MPSLIRFFLIIGVLSVVAYGAMWWVAVSVQPQQREMSQTLPPNKLLGVK